MNRRRQGMLLTGLYSAVLLIGIWKAADRFVPSGVKTASPLRPAQETIAVVELYGPISLSMGSFGGLNVDLVVRRLKELRSRKEIKAVLLRINSPGGSVAAVQEIHQEVLALKKAGKIIVSSFGDVAASGGYYIASASDKIVANPGSLTGSIGVIFQMGNVQELLKKFGVKVETIKSGEMKDAGSPFRSLTKRERRVYQTLIDAAYQQFFDAVSQGRNIPADRLRVLADGRIFTGTQALEEGLVDVLGNLDTAVQVARQLAGIRAESPPLVYTTSPWERLINLFAGRVAEQRLPIQWPSKRIRFEYIWE